MKAFLLSALILFLSSAHGQAAIPEQQQDTAKVSQYLKQALAFDDINKTDSAEKYFKAAEKLSLQLKYVYGEVRFLEEYARYLYKKLRFKEALQISQRQLELSIQRKDLKRQANSYNNIALQYHAMGNLRVAADYLVKALRLSETLKDPKNQRKYNTNLASIFIDLKDKKKSLYYATKGHDLAVRLKDTMQIGSSLMNLSIAYYLDKKYDTAIQQLLKAEVIAKKTGHQELLMNSYVNIGDVYNKKLNTKKALWYYRKADSLVKIYPDKDYELYINYGLANCYNNARDPKKASTYFDKSLKDAEKLMTRNDLLDLYLLGADINENLQNPGKALELWKKYSLLHDSLLNVSTQSSIQEAEIKYQTSAKEKAIAQQKLQLIDNSYEIQEKNTYILLDIIVIVLLMFVCATIYLIYRNKNQSIELSLLKAQIHPHFLFNTLNNLYALSLSKSDESPGVVLGLSQILRYILYECNTSRVNLNKEIEIIERYVALEKIRYQNRLEINTSIQGKLSDYEIAPLLVLPLVENAFKHGISKLPEEGWINMEIKIRADEFIFKISNNRPIEDETMVSSGKYGNIGLQNIKKRLNILYPNKHELKIISEDEVFIVVMKIKLEKRNR